MSIVTHYQARKCARSICVSEARDVSSERLWFVMGLSFAHVLYLITSGLMGRRHLHQAALQMLTLYIEISRQKQTAVKGLKRPTVERRECLVPCWNQNLLSCLSLLFKKEETITTITLINNSIYKKYKYILFFMYCLKLFLKFKSSLLFKKKMIYYNIPCFQRKYVLLN